MEAPLISVIVPVYKTEEYLEQCVDSILNQTYRNLEVILVDDGSPDNCPAMCDEIACRDGRVTVIHKMNGGLSSARNVGLMRAVGEYVLFVDSDDWIHTESCEKLVRCAQAQHCDIVHAGRIDVVNGIEHLAAKAAIAENVVLCGRDFLVGNVRKGTMSMAVCFNLYKKSIIMQNRIFFEEGRFHEDELWTPQVFLAAKRAIYLNVAFYYYRRNQSSITNVQNVEHRIKRAQDLLFVCNALYEVYQKQPRPDREILCDYLCMLYLSAIYIGKLNEEDRLFPFRTARTLRNRIKAVIHAISPTFYLWLNEKVKNYQMRE